MTKYNIRIIIICFSVSFVILLGFNYAVWAKSTKTLYDVLMNDYNLTKRKNAAIALGEIRDTLAVKYLIKALNLEMARHLYEIGKPVEVRIESAIALGKIGGKEAIDALNKRALNENNLEVKKSIAKALMKIGNDSSIPPLTFLINDSIPDVRNMAVNALEEVKKRLSLREKENKIERKIKPVGVKAPVTIQKSLADKIIKEKKSFWLKIFFFSVFIVVYGIVISILVKIFEEVKNSNKTFHSVKSDLLINCASMVIGGCVFVLILLNENFVFSIFIYMEQSKFFIKFIFLGMVMSVSYFFWDIIN